VSDPDAARHMPSAGRLGAHAMTSAGQALWGDSYDYISTPPDNTNDRLAPFQRDVHSRSTGVFFSKIFNLFRQFLQETVARHRNLDAIHAAAVLDSDTPGKLKPLVKRSLVSFGHRYVGSPSMRALMTRAVSTPGLRDA
jgi:hypothetical protein